MGLMNLPTPPEGIGLSDYFEKWLPSQLAALRPVLQTNAPDLKFATAFKAEGESGGEWTLLVKQGEIGVSPGLDPEAAVTIILSSRDMKDVISGKKALMPGMDRRKTAEAGGEIKPEKMIKQMTKTIEGLKGINGMIEFEVVGQAEAGFKARINFGPLLPEPTVSISISEEDMKAMQRGELNPQAAFMGGKVKISGDFSFLIQLAPLAMG